VDDPEPPGQASSRAGDRTEEHCRAGYHVVAWMKLIALLRAVTVEWQRSDHVPEVGWLNDALPPSLPPSLSSQGRAGTKEEGEGMRWLHGSMLVIQHRQIGWMDGCDDALLPPSQYSLCRTRYTAGCKGTGTRLALQAAHTLSHAHEVRVLISG
jgi:hypothetical protein